MTIRVSTLKNGEVRLRVMTIRHSTLLVSWYQGVYHKNSAVIGKTDWNTAAEDTHCEKKDNHSVINTLFDIDKVRRCTALAVRNKKLWEEYSGMSNKKNLLIYAHYYIPDTASTGQILRELAEGMLDKFNITVICVVPSYLGMDWQTTNFIVLMVFLPEARTKAADGWRIWLLRGGCVRRKHSIGRRSLSEVNTPARLSGQTPWQEIHPTDLYILRFQKADFYENERRSQHCRKQAAPNTCQPVFLLESCFLSMLQSGETTLWNSLIRLLPFCRLSLLPSARALAFGALWTSWRVTATTTLRQMLMCHKVTHKKLIDNSPLFRKNFKVEFHGSHTNCVASFA